MMMLVAGPIPNRIGVPFLLPHTVSPAYYSAQQPGWQAFLPVLPSWLTLSDPAATLGFFRGTDGVVPWQAWTGPLLAWTSLLLAFFFVMLCLNVLMRRQYIDHERLSFPLTAIPLALTEERAPVLRQPLFWVGLALPLLVQALIVLGSGYPRRRALGAAAGGSGAGRPLTLSPPWNGLGQVYFSFIFWLIGIVYLIPKEIAFSAWFFYFLAVMQNVSAVAFGINGEAPSVYSNDYPALYAQGAGAALALTGITLYAARRHLRAAWRKAFEASLTLMIAANSFLIARRYGGRCWESRSFCCGCG